MLAFRLADSLPAHLRSEWHGLLPVGTPSQLYHDGARCRVLSWTTMPNHVRVLVEQMPRHPLSAVVHSWMSNSSHQVNRLLGRQGAPWCREYHEWYIRDAEHLERAVPCGVEPRVGRAGG